MIIQSSNALDDLNAFRAKLADRHPGLASAEYDENWVRLACQQLRKNLRSHRETLGVGQAAMAAHLQVSQSAISKLETGQGDIGLMTLLRYAHALGLEPDLSLRPMSQGARCALAEPPEPAVAEQQAARHLALREAQEHIARGREALAAAEEKIAAAA